MLSNHSPFTPRRNSRSLSTGLLVCLACHAPVSGSASTAVRQPGSIRRPPAMDPVHRPQRESLHRGRASRMDRPRRSLPVRLLRRARHGRHALSRMVRSTFAWATSRFPLTRLPRRPTTRAKAPSSIWAPRPTWSSRATAPVPSSLSSTLRRASARSATTRSRTHPQPSFRFRTTCPCRQARNPPAARSPGAARAPTALSSPSPIPRPSAPALSGRPATIASFSAPPDKVAEARSSARALRADLPPQPRVDAVPATHGRRRHGLSATTSAGTGRRAPAAGPAIRGQNARRCRIRSIAFEAHQAAQAKQVEGFTDILNGVTPTTNPLTGETRKVWTGTQDNYWVNGVGQVVNSHDAPAPGYTQMLTPH